MKNEREILFNSVAAIINIQPTNDMFLRIMTSRDITVVRSLAQFVYGCFKQIRTAVALGSYSLAFQGRLGKFPSPLLSDEVGPCGGFQSC